MAKNTSRWDMKNWAQGESNIAQNLGLSALGLHFKKITTTLPTAVSNASTASATGSSGNASTGGAKGAKGIYNALRSVGASPAAAIGIIANAMNESSLNPEAHAMDSNGYMSYGLWQFNAASYPDASSLVTGNAAQDLIRQVQYLVKVGGLRAASGSTPAQAAGNFAANFERCAGCQPGGAQYNSRVENVSAVQKEVGAG